MKKQTVNGVIWSFLQQFSVQVINFGVQILLARLLMPEIFGLIAMLTVFISIGQTLMDGGMTNSLIRIPKPDQLDYSTVFFTNLLVSIIIYICIFIGAPFIGEFYGQEVLGAILRVYALTFVIKSFVAVHLAKLTKEMDFRTQMKLQLPSTIFGAIIGVFLAYKGYGVWSLVWLNLSQTIIFTIQSWLFIKWKPSFVFDKERFLYHFNFGYKLTLAGLLDTVYRNIYNVIVGKFFSPSLVGYFNQAETMRNFPVDQLSVVVSKVTYPLFSNINKDEQLKNVYKTTMKMIFILVVPTMFILIVSAEELFMFLFGEKWLPAVPYFKILAIASIVRPLGTYNLNILKVKGRSDLYLKIELIKKGIGFLAVLIAIPFGMTILVISYMIISHLNVFVNMIYSGKLINYSVWEQIKDSFPIYLLGVICLVLTYVFKIIMSGFLNSSLLLFCFNSLFFVIVYVFLCLLFQRDVCKKFKVLLKK